MKLFELKYETDGKTVKAPGVSETDINRCSLFYAAETPEDVWNAITDIRLDPERRFVSLAEVLPLVTVIAADNGTARHE